MKRTGFLASGSIRFKGHKNEEKNVSDRKKGKIGSQQKVP
jgi:ribosome assembly protein YihI (activator of Der GTPase)